MGIAVLRCPRSLFYPLGGEEPGEWSRGAAATLATKWGNEAAEAWFGKQPDIAAVPAAWRSFANFSLWPGFP